MHVKATTKAGQIRTSKYRPRGERRIVMNYDPWLFGGTVNPHNNPVVQHLVQHDLPGWKRAVEAVIDVHASAAVDTIVHCVFEGFTHLFPPSYSKVAYHAEHSGCWGTTWGPAMRSLHDQGYDFVQIALDRAHENGQTFLAGVRMNDRHGCHHEDRVYQERPEWRLRDFPGGFDYAKEEVRQAMLDFVGEVLEHYDVDGIEYDWMRWVHVFEIGAEERNAPMLTEFMQRSRDMVDEAGRRRGRQLMLAVRVPDVLDQCMAMGFDVEQWVDQSIVDYLVPSHFGHMDLNMQVEDFRELTEGTECRVYPSTHGPGWIGHTRLSTYGPEHYHAVANNYYAFGADGIATYNYQGGKLEAMLPRLRALTPMRDPEMLCEYDRDYRFFQRRPVVAAANEGALHYDVIHLDRSEGVGGTFMFRLAEDLTDSNVVATMQFIAVGANEHDDLKVALNGQDVTPQNISRLYFWDGTQRTHPQQRDQAEHEPYYLYSLPLASPPIVFGDNELALRMGTIAGGKSMVSIEDVRVTVHVR